MNYLNVDIYNFSSFCFKEFVECLLQILCNNSMIMTKEHFSSFRSDWRPAKSLHYNLLFCRSATVLKEKKKNQSIIQCVHCARFLFRLKRRQYRHSFLSYSFTFCQSNFSPKCKYTVNVMVRGFYNLTAIFLFLSLPEYFMTNKLHNIIVFIICFKYFFLLNQPVTRWLRFDYDILQE